jgi:hypothetical protein
MRRFLFGIVTILGALAFGAASAFAQDDYYEDAYYQNGSYDDYYDDSGPYDEDTYYGDDEYYGRDYRPSSVHFSIFFSSLSPHGRWVYRSPYGRVWIPRVNHNWRPYTVGHWVYSRRYGWIWVSDESWGWATFHYGWWDYDPYYGWYWVPGYQWSPAWVVWRWGHDSIGWAPIFASSVWGRSYSDIFIHRRRHPHVGYRDSWCFVNTRHFGDRHLNRHIFAAGDNHRHLRNGRTVFNLGIEGNRFVNRGFDVGEIERRGGRRFRDANIREVNSPTTGGNSDDVVNVFRPFRTRADNDRPFVGSERRGRGGDGQQTVSIDPNANLPFDRGQRRRRGGDNVGGDQGQSLQGPNGGRRLRGVEGQGQRDQLDRAVRRRSDQTSIDPNADRGQQGLRAWRNRQTDQSNNDDALRNLRRRDTDRQRFDNQPPADDQRFQRGRRFSNPQPSDSQDLRRSRRFDNPQPSAQEFRRSRRFDNPQPSQQQFQRERRFNPPPQRDNQDFRQRPAQQPFRGAPQPPPPQDQGRGQHQQEQQQQQQQQQDQGDQGRRRISRGR